MGAAPEQDRLLSRGDAAERLALSVRTLDALDHLGVLPKVHVLGAVRFRESDVERLIREGAGDVRQAGRDPRRPRLSDIERLTAGAGSGPGAAG